MFANDVRTLANIAYANIAFDRPAHPYQTLMGAGCWPRVARRWTPTGGRTSGRAYIPLFPQVIQI